MAENELAEVVGEVPDIPSETPPEAPPVETPPIDEAPDPASLQTDIEKLQEQRKKAEEDAQYWRKQKADARADYFKNREPAPQPEQPQTARPNPDDFDDYNDYVDKLTDWNVDEKKASWDREQNEKVQNQTHQEKMQQMHEKLNAGFQRYDDFEDVALAQTVPITPMMAEILAETEEPADIAYYLGKNHTKAIAIGRMTPIAASRAIAQIEAELSGQKPNKQPNKITNAPPPIKPVGSSNTVTKDPEKMTQAEYEAYRHQQGAKRF